MTTICPVCKQSHPPAAFNDRGRIRQTCAKCRTKRRERERSERERMYRDHDPDVTRALREWR